MDRSNDLYFDRKLIQDKISETLDTMLALEKFAYPYVMNDLLNEILKLFDYFDYEFTPEDGGLLRIRFKKTFMKKTNGYECTTKYFYSLLNPVIKNILLSNMNLIQNNIFNSDASIPQKEYYSRLILDKLNNDHIKSLYNIAIIGDNSIEVRF